MQHLSKIAAAALLTCVAAGAHAQASNVTLYGNIDQYLNYMRSSSGAHFKAVEDGEFLRSRFGVRGAEDLGNGLSAKFQMEGGFNTDTGTQNDSSRFWDRQAWVGLAHKDLGEVRVGRQNGSVFGRGGYVDYTTRTLGSMVNNFGVPSRYDNDLSYTSPRIAGVQADAHVNLPETAAGNRAKVWQFGIDWANDWARLGYAGLRGKPQVGATVDKDVIYDMVFANWMYGKGTVYVTYVHSNNNTSSAVSNNAATILSNVGGINAGTNADLRNFYNIFQVSADYRLSDQLRVGALWGEIKDKSGRDRGATGGSVGAYYDLSKRTTLIAMYESMKNDTNGGWRPSGSAGLKTTFTTPTDINGRTISGLQLGIVHRF